MTNALKRGKVIAINPTAFGSVQELLDEIYIHYLSSTLSPYSYGEQWVLCGEPFNTRIACPIDWIQTDALPITDCVPDWGSRTSLADQGFDPGSRWMLVLKGDYGFGDSFYGLKTNNAELFAIANKHAKAISYLMSQRGLSESSVSESGNSFRYQSVYRDWLSICSGKVLVDSGVRITELTRRRFGMDVLT